MFIERRTMEHPVPSSLLFSDQFASDREGDRRQRMINPVSGGAAGVQGKVSDVKECAGCHKKIHDKYVLKALDVYWHEECLKCGCCDCRLGEVGQSLYTKGNLLLCKRDYLRLFGSTGYCSACKKIIPAFEMVMRARTNVYHLECFACQECGHRFCVGDQFFLHDNKILCGPDYEERMVFASLSTNPAAQMAAIKHHDNNRYFPLNNNTLISSSSSSSSSHHKTPTPLPPISSVRSSFLSENPV